MLLKVCILHPQNMRTIIESYSQNPILETGDIQVVIIMSHGNGNKETYIKTIDGHHLKIEWIVSQFSNNICVKLAEKPKIFIFQCCRYTSATILLIIIIYFSIHLLVCIILEAHAKTG